MLSVGTASVYCKKLYSLHIEWKWFQNFTQGLQRSGFEVLSLETAARDRNSQILTSNFQRIFQKENIKAQSALILSRHATGVLGWSVSLTVPQKTAEILRTTYGTVNTDWMVSLSVDGEWRPRSALFCSTHNFDIFYNFNNNLLKTYSLNKIHSTSWSNYASICVLKYTDFTIYLQRIITLAT
jgi:hypothetical protein